MKADNQPILKLQPLSLTIQRWAFVFVFIAIELLTGCGPRVLNDNKVFC